MGFSEPIKMKVKDRANFTCCYCRDIKNKVEIHHITPQAEGGSDIEDNAAPLCSNCHTMFGGNPDLRKEIRARRDNWYKICEKNSHLETNIQEILELVRMQSSGIKPAPKVAKTEERDWELVYTLNLPEQLTEPLSSEIFAGWQFTYNSDIPRVALYPNAIMGIGDTNNSVAAYVPVNRMRNCRVEANVRIPEYGIDLSNWVGFRVRGLYQDLTLGYLAFLRADGRFDIHRVDEIIASEKLISDTMKTWTNVQVDVTDDNITARVNGKQVISIRDKWFGGKGDVYVHSYGSHALVKDFKGSPGTGVTATRCSGCSAGTSMGQSGAWGPAWTEGWRCRSSHWCRSRSTCLMYACLRPS